jgi:hypothetical protein
MRYSLQDTCNPQTTSLDGPRLRSRASFNSCTVQCDIDFSRAFITNARTIHHDTSDFFNYLMIRIQKSWLQDYNKRCLDEVGQYVLNVRRNQEAYDWIVARTGSFTDGLSACSTISAGLLVPIVSSITAVVAAVWASERL